MFRELLGMLSHNEKLCCGASNEGEGGVLKPREHAGEGRGMNFL